MPAVDVAARPAPPRTAIAPIARARRGVDDRRRATPRSASGGAAGSSTRARRGGCSSPCASARTWTSMWRGRSTYFSRKTVVVAERRARLARAPARAATAARLDVRTTRIPLPPPPADGLEQHRDSRSARASAATSSASSAAAAMPGTTGTPACVISSRARTLSPIASIASGGGPMKTMPASRQARANAAFSDRKP